MKVWITKYALTRGVFTCEVEGPDRNHPGMVTDRDRRPSVCYSGMDWHPTRQEAASRVIEMRIAKMRSLVKQIDLLKDLVVEIPE